MTIDVTEIFTAIIALITGIITGITIPSVKAKAGTEKWEQLLKIAKVCVEAAEQVFGAKHGEEKLEHALTSVRVIMNQIGLNYDDTAILAAIESSVLEINNGSK